MTNPKTSPVAESVVEHVARAICSVNQGDDSDWGVYLDDARAAIAAMARPIEDETPTDAGEGWLGPIPCEGRKPDWVPNDAIVMVAFNPREAQNAMTWEFAAKRKDPAKGRDWEAATAFCIETPLYARPTPPDTGLVGELVEAEAIAKAMFEADPDVGCTWEEWVAYATEHRNHMQDVEFTRRQARAVAALSKAKDTPHG